MCETFEGPEKNLIIYFSSLDENADLRNVSRVEWDKILLEAKCTILSKTSTFNTDSYVLSESSLFVRKRSIIIKTCGTTALLHCLIPVVEAAKALSFVLETFLFFRKNFEFPELQEAPHQSFAQECKFMTDFAKQQGLATAVTELGSEANDSCYLYIANSGKKTDLFQNRLYVLMYGLSESASKLYYKDSSKSVAKERERHIQLQVNSAGRALKKDDFLFEPCGYSMNTLYSEGMVTVHITPEEACSYASYETDVQMDSPGANRCIESILGLFKPRKYSVVMLCDEEAVTPLDTEEYVGSQVTCSSIEAGRLNLKVMFCTNAAPAYELDTQNDL